MKIPVFGIHAGVCALALSASAAPWTRHTIDASDKAMGKLGADGVRLADADGDGDLDVVTGWENGDAIRVCLNPGPDGAKRPWPGFTVGRVPGAEDAVFADLNGDGRLDVVSCTEGKTRTVFIHWAPKAGEAYDNGEAWRTEPVPGLQGAGLWMYALPFDANADGRTDLILGSKGGGATVGWLEQPSENPEDLTSWRYRPLYQAGWIMSIRAADLDGDGDEEILFSDRKGATTGIWCLENTGRGGGLEGTVFLEPRRLGLAGDEVMFIDLADTDGDGRPEVIAAVRERGWAIVGASGTRRYSFPAESGNLRTGTSKAVRWFPPAEDSGRGRVIMTCENANGAAHGVFLLTPEGDPDDSGVTPCRIEPISGPKGVKFDRMELIDLDGDGDLDVMTCEERDNLGVFWYENPDR